MTTLFDADAIPKRRSVTVHVASEVPGELNEWVTVGPVPMPPSLRVHAYTYGGVPPDALHANVILWPTSAAERSALTWALNASAGATPEFAEAAWATGGPGPSAGPAPSPGPVGTGAGGRSTRGATTLPARARAALGTIPDPLDLPARR